VRKVHCRTALSIDVPEAQDVRICSTLKGRKYESTDATCEHSLRQVCCYSRCLWRIPWFKIGACCASGLRRSFLTRGATYSHGPRCCQT
jgi:hypothetical protein